MMTNEISNDRLQECLKLHSSAKFIYSVGEVSVVLDVKQMSQELLDLRKEKAELIEDAERMYILLLQVNSLSDDDKKVIEAVVRKHEDITQKMKGDK